MDELNKRIAKLSPEQRNLLLERLKAKGKISTYEGIPRLVRTSNTFPLSFAQERIWFIEQMEPGTIIHNFPFGFRIEGPLDVEALRATLNEIVRRHETLRTSFQTEQGQPVQMVSENVTLDVPLVDLGHLSVEELDEKLGQLTFAEVQKPFDISSAPLMRATLFRRDDSMNALLLCMHHIITDTASISNFLNDFVQIYEAFSESRPSPLNKLPNQYVDYAVWQRKLLLGEKLEEEFDYWRANLSGIPRILELPIDKPRPAIQTFSGDIETFKITPELSTAVRAFAREGEATVFMTMLAVFKTLLFRYSGQEQIVVGTPIANRDRTETRDMIGLFLNNLVLCTNVGGDPSFRELLHRVRKITLAAFEHQDMPFAKLVMELQPERDLSASPLFQVMFIQLNAPTEELKLSKLKLAAPNFQNSKVSKYDLTLYLDEWDGQFYFTFEYNTDLFDSTTVKRMGEHFRILLEQIVAKPDRRISQLEILSVTEKDTFATRNETESEYPNDLCFHQLFEVQVKNSPNAVAVEFAGRKMTYLQLNRQANGLAIKLREMGIGPNVLVGICLERSLEMMVGLLGIHKAGGAYVPLDPAYPQQRLAYMLEDAEVPVLLTQEILVSAMPQFDGTILSLDKFMEANAARENNTGDQNLNPENLAYVIYTSGSTGKPKGVAIPHRALVNFLTSMKENPGITARDTLLAVTTLSFDIAALEIFLPLITGAKVVIASREEVGDGRRFPQLLKDCAATIMQATPATWRLLVDSGWQNESNLKMLCGGEALPRDLANRLLTADAELWNMYGPTETTIWSALSRVKKSEGPVFIGPPVGNTQVYILDHNLQPVPIGVPGEIYIGGDGLATGYFHRPELTAEYFIPNPFHAEAGNRLYKTGDLARFFTSGEIEFLGRIDHQVKIRGFRIEPGEIEEVLCRHPAINETAVVPKEMAPGDVRLVAYNIYGPAGAPEISELRHFLGEKLPDYMIPARFVSLESLPLTPNGKVDRQALPAPDELRPELQSTFVAPENNIERTIAGVWQDVLNLEKVGVENNFFDLGGHSLLLVQVQSKLGDLIKVELSIIDLFKYPTVLSLATYLTQDKNEQTDFRQVQDLASKQKEAMARQRRLMAEVKGKFSE